MQIGPYTIERELGRGGMGAVYLGRRPGDPQAYAIKVIRTDLANNPDLLTRFEREGVVLERLSHPNLVALRARGRFSGGLWLAMDYVRGESLEDRITRGGPLTSPLAGEVLAGVAAGLAHAHRSGILHRDLKPANVLLRAGDGQALLADFGLALPLDVSQHLTQTGEVLGSPGYLAPEQCGVGGGSTPATDVYGLGALLYATLTGVPPLRGRSLLETLDFVLTRRPRPPRELASEVDPGLEAICLRCLAKEPSERYGDAQEVLDALTREPKAATAKGPWIVTLACVAILGTGALLLARSLAGDTAGSPTPTTPARAASSPRGPAPSPRARDSTTVADALQARSWRIGHERANRLAGTRASWARYQLLAAELEVSGEEGEPWREARRAALKAASQDPSAWSQVLHALIESLEDSFLGERLGVEDLGRLRQALEGAERLPRVLTRAQEIAILRAQAEVSYRLAELRRGELDWTQAKDRHAAWATGARGSWRVHLLGAFLHAAGSERDQAFESLRRGALAARLLSHPWARLALLEVRSRWLRTPGRVRGDQAQPLLKVVSSKEAPRSIRVRASLPLSVHFVQEGRSKEAVEFLERHQPPAHASAAIRLAWLEALSRALSHGGGDQSRLLLLIGPEALGLAGSAQGARLRLGRVIALAQLGRREAARTSFAEIPRSTTQSGALLELRAAALVGDAERVAQNLAHPRQKSRLYRWEELRILEDLGTTSRLDLSAASAELFEALAGDPGQLIQSLLNAGRWEEALAALERLAKNAQGQTQNELGARWACQVLVRAREDAEPDEDRFRDAQARCRSFVRRLDPDSPAAMGLGALIEAQGEPPSSVLPQLHQDLSLASEKHKEWIELYRAHLDLLKKWKRRAQALPNLAGLERQTTDRWLAHSATIAARLASQLQPGPPDLPTLSTLAREAENKRDPAHRVALRESIRLRHLAGQVKAEHLISLLCASACWTGTLRADRRWNLLEAADLLEPSEDHAQEILAFLNLIEDWCGLPTRDEELARYRRLESEAYLALGQEQAALKAARPLEDLSVGLSDEVRARLLAQLGRAEVVTGSRGGLARIKAALKLDPSPRAYLLLARSSSGEDRARAYEDALGFTIPREWIPSLISEIQGAKLSVARLQGAAIRTLEARSREPSSGLRIAYELFEGFPKRENALLLWETYGIGAQLSTAWTQQLSPKVEASLKRAEKLLSPEELALATALRAQFAAQFEWAERPQRRRQHFVAIKAAMARLASAASGAIEFGDRLRVPLHRVAGLETLERLNPDQSLEYQNRAGRLLLEWQERVHSPLQLPILLAYRYRMQGQFTEAVGLLQEALGGLAGAIPRIAGRARLDLAVNLSDLNREREALLLCQQAQESLQDMGDLARVWLLEGQIHYRHGRWDRALGAVVLASDLCPRTEDAKPLFLRTQVCWGRILLQSGQSNDALAMVKKLSQEVRKSGLDPLLAGMVANFSAELELSRRRFRPALDRATRVVELQPASAEAHLVRVAAFVGLGELDAAKAAAKAAAQDPRLSPRDRARLQKRLDSLP